MAIGVLELRDWCRPAALSEEAPPAHRPAGVIALCTRGHQVARHLDDLRGYRAPCPTCHADVWDVIGVFPAAPRYGLAPLDLTGLPAGILGTAPCPSCYGEAQPIGARGVRLAFGCPCGVTFHRSTWPMPLRGGVGPDKVTPARDAAARAS
jgi:hypothetical protein